MYARIQKIFLIFDVFNIFFVKISFFLFYVCNVENTYTKYISVYKTNILFIFILINSIKMYSYPIILNIPHHIKHRGSY